jgi:hypothetical protein
VAETHQQDREWTNDPLERSFFSTVGKGYVIGIVIFGLFGFAIARSQASEWGIGAAIGVGVFVGVFAGILGGVVLIGLWAMKNEELIRGNETGHAHDAGPVEQAVTMDEPAEEAAVLDEATSAGAAGPVEGPPEEASEVSAATGDGEPGAEGAGAG